MSQAVTWGFDEMRSNEKTLFGTDCARTASPQPKSPTTSFGWAITYSINESFGLDGHFLTWSRNPRWYWSKINYSKLQSAILSWEMQMSMQNMPAQCGLTVAKCSTLSSNSFIASLLCAVYSFSLIHRKLEPYNILARPSSRSCILQVAVTDCTQAVVDSSLDFWWFRADSNIFRSRRRDRRFRLMDCPGFAWSLGFIVKTMKPRDQYYVEAPH